MIFHRHSNAGAMLASLLSVAFAGLLGPSSLLLVTAQHLVCDITVDIYTWEDKNLPYKKIPLPSVNVLKYGIPAVLNERFDLNAGNDTWLASDKFKSYQFKSAQPYHPGLDSDVDSSSSLDSLDGQSDPPATVTLDSNDDSTYLNSFGALSDVSATTASATTASRLRSRSLQFMPKKCWTNYKCKSDYMKKYRNRISMNGYIPTSNMCRMCEVDDDYLLENDHPREVTLDQLMGTATYNDYKENSLHLAFETDFCTELQNLKKSYPSFEHAEGCKIAFHCREADDEEFAEGGNDDLTITDLRDSGEENETELLYSITAGP